MRNAPAGAPRHVAGGLALAAFVVSAAAVTILPTAFDQHGPDPRRELKHVLAQQERNARRSPRPAHALAGAFPSPAGEIAPPDAGGSAAPRTVHVAIGELAAAANGACERMLAGAPPLPVTEAIGEDADALDLVLAGRADFALVGAPLRPRDREAGLREESLGFELFALAVPEESPVDSLACSVVRRILAGEITHWRQLGYPMGPIVLVLPADDAAARRAAWALAPRDPRRGAVPGAPVLVADAVSVHSDVEAREWTIREPGAIVLVRTDGIDPELHAAGRLVPIDGSPPTRDAFRAGAYPLGIDVRLVTPGAPRGAAARFLEFALGAEGRSPLAGRLAAP